MLLAAPASAWGADGLYGRFDGDLELRAEAGAAFAEGGPSLAASVAALYLSTVGVYAHYTDALGSGGPLVARIHRDGRPRRAALPRPLRNRRRARPGAPGPAPRLARVRSRHLLGPAARGPWASRPGLELAVGLAFPILGRATGPYLGLRAALRWRDADLTGGPGGGNSVLDRGALLSLTLGWHQVVLTHLVDAGDGLPR